jgi:hypothetical protein
MTKGAVASAIRENNKEVGAVWQGIAAQREAAYGNVTGGRLSAAEALKLDPAIWVPQPKAGLRWRATRHEPNLWHKT